MLGVEWLTAVEKMGTLAVLFFVLWRLVPTLERLTRAISRIEGKMAIEHDSDRHVKEV
jgi:hypothetical protein